MCQLNFKYIIEEIISLILQLNMSTVNPLRLFYYDSAINWACASKIVILLLAHVILVCLNNKSLGEFVGQS